MAMLHLVLVAALANLTLGQGWGAGRLSPGTGGVGLGIGGVGPGIGGVGPGIGGVGPGIGGVGPGIGGVGPGIGGVGPGIGGVGPGIGGVGPGIGGVGPGIGGVGPGIGGVGPGIGGVGPGIGGVGPGIGGVGPRIGGVGIGIGGTGSGFRGTVSGFGGVGTGIGSAGLGIGGTSSFGLGTSLFGLINPYYNTTITCSGTVPGFAFAVTLKRALPVFGPWWAQRQGGLSGSVVLRTTTATGNFQFVLTERARTEGGCTPDSLGNVFGSNALGIGLGQVFGQQWGRGVGQPWGQIFGTGRVTRPGVVADVTIANGDRTLDAASLNLPFRDLERYAGRAFAFCPSLTTGVDGRQVCMGPILACCKLGYNNKDAVVPTPL